jgi:tetratricopeptide (TPR) repeat protein
VRLAPGEDLRSGSRAGSRDPRPAQRKGDLRSGSRAGSRDPRPAQRKGDLRSGSRAGSRDPRPAQAGSGVPRPAQAGSGGDERHFSSVDRALRGFKARQNLAVLANDMGDLAEAERQWREVVREVPRYRQGWRGLGETVLRGRRFAEAESLAEALLRDDGLRIEGLLMKSRAAQTQGRLAEARDALDRAIAERPDDAQTQRDRCQFLFDNGTSDEAERTLRALIDHTPDDASVYHNLGTLLMRSGRHDEAVQEYRQALRYRPNYAATYLNLGYALKDSGLVDEAAKAWEQVVRLSPNDPVARHELAGLGQAGALLRRTSE